MTGNTTQARQLSEPRTWGWTLLVLAGWQALFLLLVHGVERRARPAGIDARADVGYQLFDAGGHLLPDSASGRASRQRLDGYVVSLPEPARRIRFDVDFMVADPEVPQALYLAIREEVREIRVNGALVQAAEPVPRLAGLLTSEPAYYPLPARALHAGANHLEIEKEAAGLAVALSEFAIGPADDLAGAFRWRNILSTDLAVIGMGILAFTLLLCLAVNWPAEDRPRIRALMLLLGSCAAATAFLTFSPPVTLSLFVFVMVWTALNLAMAVGILGFVLHEVRGPGALIRRVYHAWPVLQGLFLLVFGLIHLAAERIQYWLVNAVNAGYLLVSIAGAVAIVLLARAVVRERGRQLVERSLLALCLSALVLDRIGSIVDLHSPLDPTLPLTLSWSPIVGAFLGLSLVLALSREAAQARRTVIDSNRILSEQLAQREAELSASYAERTRMQRQAAVLEERQRLVRDMHDGIGGKLLGLRLQARHIDGTMLEQALDDSLADLRLIVDSLDTAEDDLSEALMAFERRVRPQVQAAGILLTVRTDRALEQVKPGPRATLQILRILQEALANALRHSGAGRITLAAGCVAADTLELILEDDGHGLDADKPEGQGLGSMRHRAAALGGTLTVSALAPGTHVCLRLPVRSPDPAPDMPM